MREKVRVFLQKYWNGHLGQSGYEIFSLLKKGANAVPEKFQSYLTHLMKQREGVRDTRDIPRLFVWGSIMENEKIMKVIEDAGSKVIAEDSCNGSRYFDAQVHVSDDPILSIARRYILRSLPLLHIEDLYSAGTIGQQKTRIQAFLEMIA